MGNVKIIPKTLFCIVLFKQRNVNKQNKTKLLLKFIKAAYSVTMNIFRKKLFSF